MLDSVTPYGYYNEKLYNIVTDLKLPAGYKINLKDEHIFRDGFKIDAKFTESKILSLVYNGAEIGIMHPRFETHPTSKSLYVSINFIQGIKSNEGRYPKEWYSKLVLPLVSSVYSIDPKLNIIYHDSNTTNIKHLKDKILEIKKEYKDNEKLLEKYILKRKELDLNRNKIKDKITSKEFESKINRINELIYHFDYKLSKISKDLRSLNSRLSFVTSIRDRFFNKEGILNLLTSKKSRVLNAVEFSKKVLIKNKKRNLKASSFSKVPKIKKQKVSLVRKKGPKF